MLLKTGPQTTNKIWKCLGFGSIAFFAWALSILIRNDNLWMINLMRFWRRLNSLHSHLFLGEKTLFFKQKSRFSPKTEIILIYCFKNKCSWLVFESASTDSQRLQSVAGVGTANRRHLSHNVCSISSASNSHVLSDDINSWTDWAWIISHKCELLWSCPSFGCSFWNWKEKLEGFF